MAALKCMCTKRYKDKYGRIYKYALRAINGDTTEISADKLKNAIKSGVLEVTNLSFSADGKLIVSSTQKFTPSTSENKVNTNKPKPANTGNVDSYSNYNKLVVTQAIYSKYGYKKVHYRNNVLSLIQIDDNQKYDEIKIPTAERTLITSDGTLEKNCPIILTAKDTDKVYSYAISKKITQLDIKTADYVHIGLVEGKNVSIRGDGYRGQGESLRLCLHGKVRASKLAVSGLHLIISAPEVVFEAENVKFNYLGFTFKEPSYKLVITLKNLEDTSRYNDATFDRIKELVNSGNVVINTMYNSPAFKLLVALGIRVNLIDKENQPLYDKMIKTSTKEQLLSSNSSVISVINSVKKYLDDNVDKNTGNEDEGDGTLPLGVDIEIPKEMAELYKIETVNRLANSCGKRVMSNYLSLVMSTLPINVTPFKSEIFTMLANKPDITISTFNLYKYEEYRVCFVTFISSISDERDTYIVAYRVINGTLKLVHMAYMGDTAVCTGYETYDYCDNEVYCEGIERIFSKINGVTKNNHLDQNFSALQLDTTKESDAVLFLSHITMNKSALYFRNINKRIGKFGDTYIAYNCESPKYSIGKYGTELGLASMSMTAYTLDRDFDINVCIQSIKENISEMFKESLLIKSLSGNKESDVDMSSDEFEDAKSSIIWQLAMKYRDELQELDMYDYCIELNGIYSNVRQYTTYELFDRVSAALVLDMLQLPMFEECDGLADKFTSEIYKNNYIHITCGRTKSKKIGDFNYEGRFLTKISAGVDTIEYVSYYDPLKILLLMKHIACGDRIQNSKWIGKYYSTVDESQNVRGFCNKVKEAIKDGIHPTVLGDDVAHLKLDYYSPIKNMSFLTDGYDIASNYRGTPTKINSMDHLTHLIIGIDNATGRIYLVHRECIIRADRNWKKATPFNTNAVKMLLGEKYMSTPQFAVEICDRAIACIKDTKSLLVIMKSLYGSYSHIYESLVYNAAFVDNGNKLVAYQVLHNGLGSVKDYRLTLKNFNVSNLLNVILPYIGNEGELRLEESDELYISYDEVMAGYQLSTPGTIDYMTRATGGYTKNDGYQANISEDDFDLDDFI